MCCGSWGRKESDTTERLNWTECTLKGDCKSYEVEDLIVYPLMSLLSCSPMSNSLATPWTAALQAPLSMGFPRQENWSGLLFPSSRDLPNPGIKPKSPVLAGRFFTTEPPWKPGISLSSLFFSCVCYSLHAIGCYQCGLFYKNIILVI